MEVVSSYNLFIDSDNALSGKGDEFVVQVANAGMLAGDGQFIRINLESFNMFKNFYNINENNQDFTLRTDASTTYDLSIPAKNYKTIGDIANEWAELIRGALQTDSGVVATLGAITPADTELMDDTSDRIMSVVINFASAHPYSVGGEIAGDVLAFPKVQCYEDVGDSYALFGGDRIKDLTDEATNSMITTWLSATSIKITGKYPAQRTTEEHIYLRCDLPNNNLETGGLSSSKADHSSHIISSDILAKIIIDHEFCNYTSSTGKEFFLNIPNRSINTMRFYLRDSKDRPLGRKAGNTSAGTGTAQNSLGNLNCSFVLKVEIVQTNQPKKLITAPPELKINPKKIGVLDNMNWGVGNY